MKKTLLALLVPLGDTSTTNGKIQVAYKVAQAAFVAWKAFRDHLLGLHPQEVPRTEGGEPIA